MDWVWDVKGKRRIKDSIKVSAQVTGSLELQLKKLARDFFFSGRKWFARIQSSI